MDASFTAPEVRRCNGASCALEVLAAILLDLNELDAASTRCDEAMSLAHRFGNNGFEASVAGLADMLKTHRP
jgi:hypothetical protein